MNGSEQTNTDDAQQRWAGLMDQTVAETFSAMLGLGCTPSQAADAQLPAASLRKISARIEFSGAMQGSCAVAMSNADALKIAEIFLAGTADDAMAADTVGELCNVLAGSWKRRLKPPASGAGLSVPAITHDDDAPASNVRQTYSCDGAQLVVRLIVQKMQEE